MYFAKHLTLMRGGGDLATGVAYRLHKAGFPLVVLELPQPLVVRRTVALATAVLEGEVTVEELHGRLVETPAAAVTLAQEGAIPVLVAPELEPFTTALQSSAGMNQPTIVVDARMVKRNLDTGKEQAPLVVALGPGFSAGVDCDAVVETMRGHWLGRVIWEGTALPDTGTPGLVAGKGKERVLRAPTGGVVTWRSPGSQRETAIGDRVREGEVIGSVNGTVVTAPFAGVVRGLIAPGTAVRRGLKIGDVDARGDPAACYTISDKALAVGGGVVEAVLTWLNRQEEDNGR